LGEFIAMRAAILSPDGREKVEGGSRFSIGDLDGPARLAADLLRRASPALAAHFAGSP
jgi:hydroxymethylbilane synthase